MYFFALNKFDLKTNINPFEKGKTKISLRMSTNVKIIKFFVENRQLIRGSNCYLEYLKDKKI